MVAHSARHIALTPPQLVTQPVETQYPTSRRRFQGIPGIERAPGGRLWVAWYGGGRGEGPENYVMMVTSDDDGHSWSRLRLVIDHPHSLVRCYDPCLWHDPTGRLWLFWSQSYEKTFDGRCGVWAITTDESGHANPTWTEPRRLCDGIMMNKPTVLIGGDWLLPTALWRREESCRVVASTDEGRTWSLRGTATVPEPEDRSPDEPMIIERRDGSLWMLVRTAYGIGETVSHDGGITWPPVRRSGIPHPAARFFLRRLASGQLLLVKHGPMDERTGRERLTAFLSRDDGASWQGGLLLDERERVSYPDGIHAPDGKIYIVYDRDRKGAREILLAVFHEMDVVERGSAPESPRRMPVNKAVDPGGGGL